MNWKKKKQICYWAGLTNGESILALGISSHCHWMVISKKDTTALNVYFLIRYTLTATPSWRPVAWHIFPDRLMKSKHKSCKYIWSRCGQCSEKKRFCIVPNRKISQSWPTNSIWNAHGNLLKVLKIYLAIKDSINQIFFFFFNGIPAHQNNEAFPDNRIIYSFNTSAAAFFNFGAVQTVLQRVMYAYT